jgi:IS5 family transposase
MATFFTLGAEALIGQDNQLVKLNRLIQWPRIEKYLVGVNKNDIDPAGGPTGYNKLALLKAILLGQWHSLSDRDLENSLRVRIDFMLFTGLELDEPFPDSSTLCRFRNKLIAKGIDKKIFKEMNYQLEQLGLKIESSKGAVVDATIIQSAARPNRLLEEVEMPEDRREDEAKAEFQVRDSADPDARWLKKGRHCYLGYKAFVSTSEGNGFIQALHVEPANVYEGHYLSKVVEQTQAKAVYADKGYCVGTNTIWLKKQGIKSRIMRKAARGRALSKWEKRLNKLISKRRFIVEQCFGTLKRRFEMARARYMGVTKVAGQLYLKSMCFNLNKALNMGIA